ncbi:MAG: NAD(P)H-dependent glycerol-3-phosphate dehydrogenase [Anaerolineaceae bacterium]
MTVITIIGSGLMGSAVAFPLADNGHDVRLVGTHLDRHIISSCKTNRFHPTLHREIPETVQPFYIEELAHAMKGAEVVVGGVNSQGVHWLGKTLVEHLRPEHLLISITKGLEASPKGDVWILPDVLSAELPTELQKILAPAAVGGPCIAGELAGRRQTCVVFGSRDQSVLDRLAPLFRTAYYHVWTTTDLVGLEFSVALKNAFALAVGIVDGLLEAAGGVDLADAYMYNTSAAVFAQGCTEIRQVLELVDKQSIFASGLPGAGDLYVTSMGGRTIRLGKLLGAGYTYTEACQELKGVTLESVDIVKSMARVLPRWQAEGKLGPRELPLLRMLINVIVDEQPVSLPFQDFAWQDYSHAEDGRNRT